MSGANPTGAGTATLNRLIDGYQGTALVYAALRLGLFERMDATPASAAALAGAVGVPADRLHRLLRALAAIGVVDELPDGRFAPGAAGALLRADAGSGLPEKAMLAVEHYWPAWAAFEHCVRTERSAFDAAFGTTPWEYRRAHPRIGESFDAWLAGETRTHCAAVVEALDLRGVARVADIGGGSGALLQALLDAHPQLAGVLFDQPHVIGAAAGALGATLAAGRLELAGGDFFAAVPVQAGLYLLKSVIHDWDDAESVRILRNCRAAMPPGARLALIERVLPARACDDTATVLVDVQMMAITGGRERRLEEFTSLLRDAGLAPSGVTRTATGFTIIEAVPA